MTEPQYLNLPSLDEELKNLSREQLVDLLRHCAPVALDINYDTAKEIAKEGTIDIKGNPREGLPPAFEYSEHRYLGNQLHLQGHDTARSDNPAAEWNPLTLKNGISMTYGTINGLAGDFFSVIEPISLGSNPKQCSDRFKAAFDTLWSGDPAKVQEILKVLQEEVNQINTVLKDFSIADQGKAIRNIYENLDPKLLNPLDVASQKGTNPGTSYKDLLQTNLDHFAPNSRLVYDTGHAWALEVAAGQDLPRAYAIDAFATHFLEDNFASGHLRVPRNYMWDSLAKNVCVNMMHNEDNTLGVQVQTQGLKPTTWRAYGDSMLFDDNIGKATKAQCLAALKASVDEVYEAYTKKTTKAAKDFKAWDAAPTMTPTLERPAAHNLENHPPMFRVENEKVLQRKGLLPYETSQVSKTTKWEYEPVVTDTIVGFPLPMTPKFRSYLEFVSWSILAFRLTPYSTMATAIKQEVEAWLEKLPFPIGPAVKRFWGSKTSAK